MGETATNNHLNSDSPPQAPKGIEGDIIKREQLPELPDGKLKKFLDTYPELAKQALAGEKKEQFLLFISSPEVFEQNPTQLSVLFERFLLPPEWIKEFQDPALKPDTVEDWPKDKRKAYRSWKLEIGKALDAANQSGEAENARKLAVAQTIQHTGKALDAANQAKNETKKVVDAKEEVLTESIQKRLERITGLNQEIKDLLPDSEKSKATQRVEEKMRDETDPINIALKAQGITGEARRPYLESAYFIENTDTILGTITDPAQRKIFEDKIGELGKIDLFRSIPKSKVLDELGRTIPPGSVRDTAIATVGKYEKTHDVYRDGRNVYLADKNNPKGELIRLDLSGDKVRMSIIRGNLSISHDIDNISPEEQARQKLTTEILNLTTRIQSPETTDKIKLIKIDNPASPELLRIGKDTEEFRVYASARQAFTEAKNPSEKLEAIKVLERANTGMDTLRRRNIQVEGDAGSTLALESALGDEKESLGILRSLYTSLVTKEKELAKLGPSTDSRESFDTVASHNLEFLNSIGFDTLGNKAKDTIISAINKLMPASPTGEEFYDLANKKIDTGSAQAKVLILSLMKIIGKGKLPQDTDWISKNSETWNTLLKDSMKPGTGNLVTKDGTLKDRDQIVSVLSRTETESVESKPSKATKNTQGRNGDSREAGVGETKIPDTIA